MRARSDGDPIETDILGTLNVSRRDMSDAPATFDSLTGLANRHGFQLELARLLSPGQRAAPSLLVIDLDRFKAVNDSVGHPVGDALLAVVGKRLRGALREQDGAFRIGGDEFAVIVPSADDAAPLAARLVALLSRPYKVRDHLCTIGASIGIANAPADGADCDTLVRNADLALYEAKHTGRGGVRQFRPELDERARARQALEVDLRQALALEQFELHYQAQIHLQDNSLLGFEALVRWQHPVRGLVPPDNFIPLAEAIGLIVPIGEWVLGTACRDATAWPEPLAVAVNISVVQLEDSDRLVASVQAALAQSGLAPSRLELEITESALLRYGEPTLAALTRLQALGVRISMDDFGTGYSSLSQLRAFPFDKLKIDRSFVRDLGDSKAAFAMVRAIAGLGTSLGMSTTAEGVETTEQAELASDAGCSDMQGFLISRPIPAADLAALLARFSSKPDPEEES